jgi:hypothetical protein
VLILAYVGVNLAQGSTIQSSNYAYSFVDRLMIISSADRQVHSSIKPYRRGDLIHFADQLISENNLSLIDLDNIHYLYDDSNEFVAPAKEAYDPDLIEYIDSTQTFYTWSSGTDNPSQVNRYRLSNKTLFGLFYKTPANFFEVNKKDFYLRVNPILSFGLGDSKEEDGFLFNNQRGVELRGGIDNKIFFYTNLIETQTRFPNYVNNWTARTNAVPGAGFFKSYKSTIFNSENSRDYLTAEGFVSFPVSKHVGIELGHGRNFIGDGYRSLLLSDFANPYFYLKFNTRVWKFHYQNIFAELSAKSHRDEQGDNLIPKKYFAAHYLNLKVLKNLSIGVMEAIVFGREDHFEFQYLNPVIFYRTVEQGVGSPDNAMIGLNLRWDILNRISLYGQFLLDDINLGKIFSENAGFWGNRYGFQVGFKYVDVLGINQLDMQVETNHVRPYTFAHRDSTASYATFNQPLAHPLGANFREYVLILKYQPLSRLLFDAKILFIDTGEDMNKLNYGSNILLPNENRPFDTGVEIGQGIPVDNMIMCFGVSYHLKHNLFIDLVYFKRDYNSELQENDLSTQYFSLGFRLNLGKPNLLF